MLFKLTIIISVILTIECRQSYIIRGPGWKNEIKKCASGGDDKHDYPFHIGTLNSIGLKYKDVNSTTIVKAYGDFLLHTKSSGDEPQKNLYLTEYVEENGYKQFSKMERTATTSGWAAQTVAYRITVTIHQEGLIELTNYVYAGSWGAVTCAWTKAFVDSIEIVN